MSHRARKALSFLAAAVIALLAVGTLVIFNPDASAGNPQLPTDPFASPSPALVSSFPSPDPRPTHGPAATTPIPVRPPRPMHVMADPPDGSTVGHLPDGTVLQIYTVRHGDNLSFIAWKFHTQADKLYTWSRGVIGARNPNLIFAGQKIVV
jgi:hypothetical protein